MRYSSLSFRITLVSLVLALSFGKGLAETPKENAVIVGCRFADFGGDSKPGLDVEVGFGGIAKIGPGTLNISVGSTAFKNSGLLERFCGGGGNEPCSGDENVELWYLYLHLDVRREFSIRNVSVAGYVGVSPAILINKSVKDEDGANGYPGILDGFRDYDVWPEVGLQLGYKRAFVDVRASWGTIDLKNDRRGLGVGGLSIGRGAKSQSIRVALGVGF